MLGVLLHIEESFFADENLLQYKTSIVGSKGRWLHIWGIDGFYLYKRNNLY